MIYQSPWSYVHPEHTRNDVMIKKALEYFMVVVCVLSFIISISTYRAVINFVNERRSSRGEKAIGFTVYPLNDYNDNER